MSKDNTTHHELGPPTWIINQENVLQTCLKAGLMEVFSHLELFFPDNSSFVKLTKNYPALGQSIRVSPPRPYGIYKLVLFACFIYRPYILVEICEQKAPTLSIPGSSIPLQPRAIPALHQGPHALASLPSQHKLLHELVSAPPLASVTMHFPVE